MINKLILSILVLVGYTSNTIGQGQVLDSVYLKTQYLYKYRPDSTNLTRVNEDIVVLELGKKFSKFYSYYKMVADSLLAAQRNVLTGEIDTRKASESLKGIKPGSSTIIFRNLVTNVFTISSFVGADIYRYKDSIKALNWTITADTATISTYHCTKAKIQFRGRNYEAWFTKQVPISIGPFLFYGLPGMIVRIRELKGNFEFNLISLELVRSKVPMYLDNKNFKLISRKEFRRLLILYLSDPDAFLASQGMILKTISVNGNPNPPPQPKRVYNLMELE
jgi:GLPGLI family protein